MNSKEYVLNHDYGYGEGKAIKKLKLRNVEDVEHYANDLVNSTFVKVENGVIHCEEKFKLNVVKMK